MSGQIDGDDYRLRVLVERMQRNGSAEHEIVAAVREAGRGPGREACRHDPAALAACREKG